MLTIRYSCTPFVGEEPRNSYDMHFFVLLLIVCSAWVRIDLYLISNSRVYNTANPSNGNLKYWFFVLQAYPQESPLPKEIDYLDLITVIIVKDGWFPKDDLPSTNLEVYSLKIGKWVKQY